MIQLIKWFSINIHLLPSYLCFFVGAFLSVLVPIKYQIRMKKIIILNPFKMIQEFTPSERKMYVIGITLGAIGVLSLYVIENVYGYYYLKDGTPTLIK